MSCTVKDSKIKKKLWLVAEWDTWTEISRFQTCHLKLLSHAPIYRCCILHVCLLNVICLILQEDLFSSTDGSDVIIIENFPSTINEQVCW